MVVAHQRLSDAGADAHGEAEELVIHEVSDDGLPQKCDDRVLYASRVYCRLTFIILPILAYQVRWRFPDQTIHLGWDPVSLVKHSPVAWLLLFLAFAIGFVWEYRRLTS